MPIKCMNPKGDRSRAANWMTLEEPKARLSVLITVLLALAAALFPQADGHVAQAQSTTPTQVQMVYSLFEVDPLEFEEDVGTVRVGILAETNETGAPTTASHVTLSAKFGTAGSEAECLPPDDYRPISEVLLFRSTDFEAFTNDDGETRYRQSLYRDVWIFDDRVLEEDESFQLTLEPFHQAVGNPLFDVDELDLTIIDNDGFVGVAFESTAITVTEGTASTYRLALGSLPSGNVTVAIVDPPNAEVTAEPGAVTFTPTDWYVPQTVTVAADHDADATDETIMTIAHRVSSVDDSNFEGLIDDDVTVTVRDDDGGGTNTSKTSLDHDTAAVRGANGQGLISERAADLKIDFALVAPEPVREDAGTVRIEVVAATYSPGEPSYTEISVYPYDNTAKWGRDYRFGGWTDDEYYVADEIVDFLSEDFEPFDDIEGDTRYRAVKYFDIDIINDSLAEDAESFGLIFLDEYGDLNIADRECVSVYFTAVTIIDDDPPVQMEYSLVEAGPFEEDAGTVQVEVVAVTNEAGVPNTEYAVGVRSQNGTARAVGDYDAVDETLEFPVEEFEAFSDQNGDARYRQTVSFDVVIVDNFYDEDAETFLLKLSDSTGYEESVFGVPEIEVTINDNDTAGVTVTPTALTIEEGTSDTYEVVLDTRPSNNVRVTINDPANTEVTANPAWLTFTPNNWDQPRTVTVTADHDSDATDEAATEITHTVTSAFAQYDGLSADSVTVTATDDEHPAVEVSFEQSGYSVTEGSGVIVKVKLNADPEREVIIPIRRTNQEASDSDYRGVPTNVTFDSGDTEKSFTFTADDDADDDDGESVKLTFVNLPAGVSAGTTDEAVVSITDNDAPSSLTVNFRAGTYSVTEGSTVEVVLTLDDDPERTVIIPIDRDNQDGASDSDYSGVPTSVTFNSGDTSKSFMFSAASDRIGDPGEKVSINLGPLPPGVTEGTTSETVVTIEDVALSGSTTVSFGADIYGVLEGSSTTITVVMSPAPGSDAIIRIDDEGQDGATSADYSVVPASVTFGATETSKTFTFTAEHDTDNDDGESVKLTFVNLPTGVSAGTISETTVSITDDDVPAVEVSFEQSGYSVTEGSGVIVKVKLNADPEREVIIPIRRTNQGASDSDYRGVPTSVTFDSGDTEKSFTFTADDDADNDDGESVKLTFVNLPAGVSAGTISETTVSITDNDHPNVEVSFEQSGYSVTEGSGVIVKVKLNADPEREVIIPIRRTNQGASDSDYRGVPTSVTFDSGDTEKSFTFTADDDADDDDGESVKLTFVNLPTGVSAGTISETTVSITDNDHPNVEVSFEQSGYSVTEGSNVIVKVKLNADPEREVIIPIRRTNQGASDSDYSGVPTSVTFDSGDTEKSFTFTADDDADGRRRREREADVREPAHGRERRDHLRDDRLHHRQRPSECGGELRAVRLQRDGGQQRHSEGEAQRRPGARGHHPDQEDEPGGVGLRLQRRAHQRDLRLRRHREELHVHGGPMTRTVTTTGRASS